MKYLIGIFLLALSLSARAQDDALSLPDLVKGAQQWAQQNLDTNIMAALDTNALAALPDIDQQKVEQLLHDLEQQFHGEYVLDLASLKDTASAIMPLLDAHSETEPYAAWLKPRLDYLQIADQFKSHQESPTPPNRPATNPSPEAERTVWVKEISTRPWPAKAHEYVPQLKPVFALEKVPAQLVWLAEVESSFNTRARSPEGAAGLFQLMPDTAKRFGLSLWPRDQRLQVEPSARASAQYLKFLHGHFHDWRLTLAAYNAGEGAVQKLLDRYQTHEYDSISRHLPAETQLYVPKVEAIILHREGLTLAQLPPPES